MTDFSNRTDKASLLIRASPEKIYDAFLDPDAIASWRPPSGMSCEIFEFDPREGGRYRMVFRYNDTQQGASGKTSMHEDEFTGKFKLLEPNQKIVEEVVFKSDDPAFAGNMIITTTLQQAPGGTQVNIVAEQVPAGISREDHYAGMMSSLKNLALYTEQEPDITV
ncbi:SRPBCC family protein [Pseudoflavitalea rhizosphaerae]|uniref:SRPBCC family protein n=1 Tax=Pseudoflavitalea rhizosphaerae TaxID=1884793 RepID=UPI000F8DFA15|nr:SRPBCC family protein [Pseudoflavitalea rhizosphaerae]